MKKYVFKWLIVFSLFGCNNEIKVENQNKSEENDRSDLQKDFIRGPVKEITEVRFWAEDKFGNINKILPTEKTRSIYNNKGNLIKVINLTGIDSILSTTEYKYDTNDNLIEKVKVDKNNKIIEKSIFKYITPEEVKINIYNSEGNLSQIIKLFQNYLGDVTRIEVLDSDGNLIREGTNQYDNHNRMTREIFKNPDGSLLKSINYHYNDNDIWFKTRYEDMFIGVYEYTHKYKFDSLGNWILRVDYLNDITIETATERNIIYH